MPWRAVSDRINSCTGPGAAPRAAPSAKAGATCSLQALTSEALRCLARQVGRRLVRWCEAQLLDADRPVVATAHEDALTFPEGLDLHAREAEGGAFHERCVADRQSDATLGQLIEQRPHPTRHALGLPPLASRPASPGTTA